MKLPALHPRFFGLTFLLSLAALTALQCLLLTVVNPRRYFGSSDAFPQVFTNSRRVKTEAFLRFQQEAPVTGLILGSSRSMLLAPAEFDRRTGLRFFNGGVFAGTAEDFLSVYRFARAQGQHPQVVVLGLDPAAIFEGSPSEELAANFALASALEPPAAGPLSWWWHQLKLYKKMLRLQSLVEIATSLHLWRNPPEERNHFYADGQLHEQTTEKAIQTGRYDFRRENERSRQRMLESLRNSKGLSARRTRMVEQLIQEAQADHARVIVWMPPLHPALRQSLTALPEARTADEHARAFTLSLAQRYPVQVIDLTDPGAFGGNPDRWYDAIHPSPQDADKIARQLAAYGI